MENFSVMISQKLIDVAHSSRVLLVLTYESLGGKYNCNSSILNSSSKAE